MKVFAAMLHCQAKNNNREIVNRVSSTYKSNVCNPTDQQNKDKTNRNIGLCVRMFVYIRYLL